MKCDHTYNNYRKPYCILCGRYKAVIESGCHNLKEIGSTVITRRKNKMAGPKFKVRAGAIKANIWENDKEFNGRAVKTLSVQLVKSYKKKDGQWEDMKITLNPNDIPKLEVVLAEAKRKMFLSEENVDESPSSQVFSTNSYDPTKNIVIENVE